MPSSTKPKRNTEMTQDEFNAQILTELDSLLKEVILLRANLNNYDTVGIAERLHRLRHSLPVEQKHV